MFVLLAQAMRAMQRHPRVPVHAPRQDLFIRDRRGRTWMLSSGAEVYPVDVRNLCHLQLAGLATRKVLNIVLQFLSMPPHLTASEELYVKPGCRNVSGVPVCSCSGPHRPLLLVPGEGTPRCWNCANYMPRAIHTLLGDAIQHRQNDSDAP